MASKRERLYPEIKRLREAEGLKWREIGERLGLALTTVQDYYIDPTGEKAAKRKARNDGACVDCGVPTRSGGGKVPPPRCVPCSQAHSKVWGPAEIVAAVQRWADEHGGVPPTATDWRNGGRDHPATSTVIREMGWRAAIVAAGFDAFATGCYGRDGEQPEVVAETVALYRQGLSLVAVGERMGVSQMAVLARLRKAGEPRRTPWQTRRAA